MLERLSEGLSTKGIAEALELGDETVKTHLSRIYTKLGTKDRTETVASAAAPGGGWCPESAGQSAELGGPGRRRRGNPRAGCRQAPHRLRFRGRDPVHAWRFAMD